MRIHSLRPNDDYVELAEKIAEHHAERSAATSSAAAGTT